jgi:hypothetical protein
MMSKIKSRTIFKLTGTSVVGSHTLTPEGVYYMATAKADHGQTMRIFDMATTRLTALGGTESGPVINVSTEQAETIEAYVISN